MAMSMSLCCRASPRAQDPNSQTAALCSPSALSTIWRNSSIACSRTVFTRRPHSSRPPALRGTAGEIRPEVLPGVARLARSDVFRGAGGDDMAAGVAAFGAELDNLVGGL